MRVQYMFDMDREESVNDVLHEIGFKPDVVDLTWLGREPTEERLRLIKESPTKWTVLKGQYAVGYVEHLISNRMPNLFKAVIFDEDIQYFTGKREAIDAIWNAGK